MESNTANCPQPQRDPQADAAGFVVPFADDEAAASAEWLRARPISAKSDAPVVGGLPGATEAETGLVACCVQDFGAPIVLRAIAAGITSASFSDEKLGIVFAAAVSLVRSNETPDVHIVAARLQASQQLKRIGDWPFIVSITTSAPTQAHAALHIKQVVNAHRLRRLQARARRVIDDVAQPNADAVEISAEIHADLDRIGDSSSAGLGLGVTADVLCSSPPPIPAELIAGVLYRSGTMMLSGPSKSRKTYTFLDLGVSVATGNPWLGFPTAKGSVSYINFELSEHSFQRRLAAICTAKRVLPPANFHAFNLRGRPANMMMLAGELPRLIKQHDIRLVVLDPWYKISAQSGAEENSNDGQARILAEAERIVTGNGAALVVGHHFSKGDSASKNSIDRAAGAGAMARWGDVIATLSEHEEADAMTLEFHLRDFAPVAPIALRWELPLWRRDASLDPAKLKRVGRSDAHPSSELLAKLIDGMNAAEWRDAAGWSESTFRRKRDDLLHAGKVVGSMGTYRRP